MRWRGPLVALVAMVLVAPIVPAPVATAGASGATGTQADNPCVGTVASPANGTTLVSVQGAILHGGSEKKLARVVAVGPRGEIRWVHHSGNESGIVWSYDVDPLPDGNVFVTATRPRRTVFYEFDPRDGTIVWEEVLPLVDTHDADLLDEDRILIANMRGYNATTGRNNDRLLIYNRTADAVEWEWRFAPHLPRDGGGNYSDDWTHVNDVDRIAPGEYLASVRNFDQVVVVNRSTGRIGLRLGSDDDYTVMREQHNPQYLETAGGKPTILVADSDNGRIVEYTRDADGWTRTWEVGSPDVFAWPRDADRLPNGNTLIVDSANHRVVEVTPRGEVVWEFYSPWLVYDAERVRYGDEAGGPTIRDLGAAGTYPLDDAAPRSREALEPCAEALRTFENPDRITPLPSPIPPDDATPSRAASDERSPVDGNVVTTPADEPPAGSPDGGTGGGSPATTVALGGIGAVALGAAFVLLILAVRRYRRR